MADNYQTTHMEAKIDIQANSQKQVKQYTKTSKSPDVKLAAHRVTKQTTKHTVNNAVSIWSDNVNRHSENMSCCIQKIALMTV